MYIVKVLTNTNKCKVHSQIYRMLCQALIEYKKGINIEEANSIYDKLLAEEVQEGRDIICKM